MIPLWVEIPKSSGGSVAIDLHSIAKVEGAAGSAFVKLHDGSTIMSSLSVARILNRISKIAKAYEDALRRRRGLDSADAGTEVSVDTDAPTGDERSWSPEEREMWRKRSGDQPTGDARGPDKFVRINGVLRNVRFLTTKQKKEYLGYRPRRKDSEPTSDALVINGAVQIGDQWWPVDSATGQNFLRGKRYQDMQVDGFRPRLADISDDNLGLDDEQKWSRRTAV